MVTPVEAVDDELDVREQPEREIALPLAQLEEAQQVAADVCVAAARRVVEEGGAVFVAVPLQEACVVRHEGGQVSVEDVLVEPEASLRVLRASRPLVGQSGVRAAEF